MKALSYDDYGNPNVRRRLSNVVPPPGIPYEYNYRDYINAWAKVFLYQNI